MRQILIVLFNEVIKNINIFLDFVCYFSLVTFGLKLCCGLQGCLNHSSIMDVKRSYITGFLAFCSNPVYFTTPQPMSPFSLKCLEYILVVTELCLRCSAISFMNSLHHSAIIWWKSPNMVTM